MSVFQTNNVSKPYGSAVVLSHCEPWNKGVVGAEKGVNGVSDGEIDGSHGRSWCRHGRNREKNRVEEK